MGRRAGTRVSAVALLVFGLLMVLRPLPPGLGAALSLVVQTVTVLAACALTATRARAASGRLRAARALLSGSLLFATLGGVLALVLRLVSGQPPPVPSVADVAHFLYLPLCVAGVLSYPVSDDHPGSTARTLLDGLIAASALWFITYVLLLAPAQVGEGTPALVALTMLGYPACDVFVIAMAAGALHRVAPEARRELALNAAGVGLYAVSDIAYTVLAANGSYVSDSWVAALAEAGLALMVVAVLPSLRPVSARAPAWVRSIGAAPYAPVVLALGLAGWLSLSGDTLQGRQLSLLVTVMIALLLRQIAGARDNAQMTRRLRERKALFRSLVVGSSDLITLHDADMTMRYASPAVSRLTGLSADELARTPLAAIVHPEDRHAVLEVGRLFRTDPGSATEMLLRVRAESGEWRWCRTLAHDLLADPDVRGIVCNTRDVHERHLLEQQAHHDAHHDALTGLGNLAQARALLAQACAQDTAGVTVALVDLDGFKQVNDTFGHGQGDALLQAVAARLRGCVRGEDIVTRIGGDEFLLVLPADVDGTRVGERILAALREPLSVGGRPLTIGASVGLASTADHPTPDELLRNADLAMYSAKTAGRNRFAWYEPRLHESATQRMQISRGLRRALQEQHFALHYQPLVALPGGEVVGAEALLRWQDPDGSSVPPDVFIPVAEESGVMLDIDAWVLERACRDLAGWLVQGLAVARVSVNISRRHLTRDLPELVADTLQRHGLRGDQLCVEVTESAVAPDPEMAVGVLTALRATGVQIALDDFGTGQSSLSQLAQLPIDVVKIDKSFLLSAPGDAGALRLLGSIVGICKALSLPVVAEGIEHALVVEHLAASGCAFGQGYHFGRPQPADELARLLPRRALVPGQRTASPAVEPAALGAAR